MDKATGKINEAMQNILDDYSNGLITKGESLLIVLDVVQGEIDKYKIELEEKNSSVVDELSRLK